MQHPFSDAPVSNSSRAHLSKRAPSDPTSFLHPLMMIGSPPAPSSSIDLVRAHLGLSSAEPAFWISRYALSWLGSSASVAHALGYGGRNPWGRHMARMHRGLVLVVHSADRAAFGMEDQSIRINNAASAEDENDTIPTAKEMLAILLAESDPSPAADHHSLPLLVLATGQEQPAALSLDEIIRALGLRELSNRVWRVSSCDAVSGKGVAEASQWLRETLDATAPAVRSFPLPIAPIRSGWTAPSAAHPTQRLDAESNVTSTIALQPKSSSAALPARFRSANRTGSAILAWLPALLLLWMVWLVSTKRAHSWRVKKSA